MAPNRHQPKKSPSPSVGAGVDEDVGLGRLRRPRPSLPSCGNMTTLHPTGDHKGPHRLSSSALAPTDRPALCLASRLRLMRIGRPRGSPVQYTLTCNTGKLVLYGRPSRSPWRLLSSTV